MMSSYDDAISAVEDYFEGQEETFFKTGTQMLKVTPLGKVCVWTTKEIM